MLIKIFSNSVIGFKLALRARFHFMFLGVMGGGLLAAWMAAYFSGRQPSVITLDVGISVIRIFFPVVLVLLTQELIFKEFDRRYFLGSLSYPGERMAVLLGRFTSVFALVLAWLLLAAIFLGWLAWGVELVYGVVSSIDLWEGYVVTILFIAVDFILSTQSLTKKQPKKSTK